MAGRGDQVGRGAAVGKAGGPRTQVHLRAGRMKRMERDCH